MAKSAIKVHGMTAALGTLRRVRTGWSGSARWVVGVGAEYGAYVEFGTSRNRAQPYLFPAARKVMRTEFPAIEARAAGTSRPLENLVALTANAIEAEAKRRAPVDTGNLRASIEAAPAGAISGRF